MISRAYLRPNCRYPDVLTYQVATGISSLVSHGRRRIKGAREIAIVTELENSPKARVMKGSCFLLNILSDLCTMM